MGKINFTLNSNPEKIIAAASISVALAILFDGKSKNKKRGGKENGFVKRTMKNYRIADRLLAMTVAKNIANDSDKLAEILAKSEYKTKLGNMEIEDSIPFDLQEDL